MCNKLTSNWEPVEHGVPQGSVLGPLLFLIYINDLSVILNKAAKSILFADDTSIIVSNADLQEFQNNASLIMNKTIKWFQSNLLTLNSKKTHFLQFFTQKKNDMSIQIVVPNSIILNVNSTKFLGLTIDSSLSWKDHNSDLTSKLNKACFAVRAIKPVMSSNVLRTVYFYYFQSIMSYDIIFWGNPQFIRIFLKFKTEY